MKRLVLLIWVLSAVPARAGAAEKITYEDHVRPIFNTSCISCHNPDKNKAGLNLTTYQGALAGSSDGKVIQPGAPDESMMYLVVTHQQEPHMPPKSGKLPDAQLEIIRKWIEAGALESSGSSVAVAAKPKTEMKPTAAAAGKPQGPPPMPRELPLDPIVRSDRTAAPGALAASPRAPLIALAAPHQVLLYHAQTRELLGVLPFAAGLPKVLAFSRNGSVLLAGGGVGGQSGKVVLYDVITGRQIGEVGEEYDEVLAADISPDQSTVALGGPGKLLKIYSTSGGPPLHKLTQHTDWITAVAYSPDGVLLASGDRNGGLRVWEAASGNEFYTLSGHKAAITRACFRADSNVLASCSEDGTAKLWDMSAGTEIKSWPGHAGGTLAVDFAADGRLVTAGRDQVVRLWAADGTKLLDLAPLRDIAIHAVFAQQGALVVADDFSGQVKVSSAADGKGAGDLDTNPPPIAERIVEARKRLADAETAASKATAEVAAPQTAADKASADLQSAQAAVTTAQRALTDAQEKVKAAAAATQPAAIAFDAAAKDLAIKQAEHDRLAQVNTQAQAALRAATAEQTALAALVAQRKQTSETAAVGANAKPQTQPSTTAPATLPSVALAASEKAASDLATAQQQLAAKAEQLKPVTDAAQKAKDAFAVADAVLAAAKQNVDAKRAANDQSAAALAASNAAFQKAPIDLATVTAAAQPRIQQAKAAGEALAKARAAADASTQQFQMAKAELTKWKRAQVAGELAAARQELAEISARQERLTHAMQEIEAANQVMRDGPQKVQQGEQRVAKAKESAALAAKVQQESQAKLAVRESLAKQSAELLKNLQAASTKEPQDKSLVDATRKAQESLEIVNAELTASREVAIAAAAAGKSSESELAAAASALVSTRAELAGAPKRLDDAKRVVTSSAGDELTRVKERIDKASSEQDRLQRLP